jgi:hypothetical protein
MNMSSTEPICIGHSTRKRRIQETYRSTNREPISIILRELLAFSLRSVATIMDTTKKPDQLIVLRSQDDWEQWFEQLQAMVTPTAWKKFIDPDSSLLPAVPVIDNDEPIESAYSATYTAAVRRAREEQTEDPEFNRAQYHLTNKEKDEFRFDLEVYTRKDLPKFKAEERDCTEAAQIMRRTCDDTAKLYLKAGDPLRTQVTKLREVYRGDQALRKRRAREAYKAAIQRTATAKTILDWLSKWQEAMLLAEAAKLPHALDYEQWTTDLTAAIGELIPSTITRILQTQSGNDNLTTHRAVAQAVQAECSMRLSIRPAQSGARRGAFMTAAVAGHDGSDQSNSQNERPRAKAGGAVDGGAVAKKAIR